MISAKRRAATASTDIFERLRSDHTKVLILDGGTGEELFKRGVPDDRKTWSATAVVKPEYHDILKQVHQSYMTAGSDAITTNSFGIIPGVGFTDDEVCKYVATAGKIARQSVLLDQRRDIGEGDCSCKVVCGSLGPLVESYRPDKLLPHERGVAMYQMMARSLLPYVDCFLAETMSSFEEVLQVIEAIGGLRENSHDDDNNALHLPMLLASYTLSSDGSLRSGESAVDGVRRLMDAAKRNQVHLLGVLFNCCEPESITIALQNIRSDETLQYKLRQSGVLLGAYANRLTPVASDWTMAGSDGPQETRKDLLPDEYFDSFVNTWIKDLGVRIVGGCCGITPEHIAYIRSHVSSARV